MFTNHNKIRILVFIFALLAMTCVCPNLDTLEFTTTEPSANDLVGVYLPLNSTLELIEEGGYTNTEPKITINADGTFSMEQMPDWWNIPFGESKGGYDSGAGTWGADACQNWWCLTLHFDSQQNFNSTPGEAGRLATINLSGEAQPYQLWFFVGDPDSGDIMIFEQELP